MPITVTDKAVSEIKRIIAEQEDKENVYLRIRVLGGGCAGFQTKLDLDANVNEKTDTMFEVNGVNVVIDKRSLLYVADANIDYLEDLNKRGFNVVLPMAKTTCGCGSSFSM